MACRSWLSGTAPTTESEPLTNVTGTEATPFWSEYSGNEPASTVSAVTQRGLRRAISCARRTARGQKGQVGVTNTSK